MQNTQAEVKPTVGYMSAPLAQQDIGRFMMQRYNWERPHQFNYGLPPAVAEEKLNAMIRDQLTTTAPSHSSNGSNPLDFPCFPLSLARFY